MNLCSRGGNSATTSFTAPFTSGFTMIVSTTLASIAPCTAGSARIAWPPATNTSVFTTCRRVHNDVLDSTKHTALTTINRPTVKRRMTAPPSSDLPLGHRGSNDTGCRTGAAQ